MTESRRWFALALLVGLGWLVHRLAPVITPFAISAVLAYLGDPLVDRLERLRLFRWRLSRTAGVVIVFVLLSGILGALLLLVLPLVRDQVIQLAVRAPEIVAWAANTALPWLQVKLGLAGFELNADDLQNAARTYWKEASATLLKVLESVSRGGVTVFQWLMNLVLIPVVTFYLLRDWDRLVEGVRNLIPRKDEPVVSAVFGEIDEVLGAFLRGQLMVMVALGTIYSVGLMLVGVELNFIIGMGAGLLSIVPYLGTFVGVAAAVVAALFQFHDVLHVVLVLAVFGVGQSLESMVLTPYLVGDRIGLHPVTVIFAVLAGGQLFGFLGILLALPVAAALNVLVRHLNIRYRNSSLYGREAPDSGED